MLKIRENIIATTQNKVEIMFETYFLFSSTIFMNDIKKFVYSLSINDNEAVTRREIIKVVYKINLNKMSRINKVINKALR